MQVRDAKVRDAQIAKLKGELAELRRILEKATVDGQTFDGGPEHEKALEESEKEMKKTQAESSKTRMENAEKEDGLKKQSLKREMDTET